jgi:hypothetical protein
MTDIGEDLLDCDQAISDGAHAGHVLGADAGMALPLATAFVEGASVEGAGLVPATLGEMAAGHELGGYVGEGVGAVGAGLGCEAINLGHEAYDYLTTPAPDVSPPATDDGWSMDSVPNIGAEPSGEADGPDVWADWASTDWGQPESPEDPGSLDFAAADVSAATDAGAADSAGTDPGAQAA